MLVIFGDKHRTEPVPGGLCVTRTCTKCGVRAEFRERRVSKQFRIYFVGMFTHGTHHVLECGACGTAFVTDELKAKATKDDQDGTILGHLQTARDRAEALARSPEVTDAVARGKREVGKAASLAQAKLGGLMSSLLDEGEGEGEGQP